jgi:uncharacterized phage protein (TIGR01671 family)
MREILFRGKRTDNGEWVQGSLFAECSRVEIIRGTCNNIGIEGVGVIPGTVGQYTGLTDKNGKRIFEGDIVKIENRFYTVSFEKGCWVILGKSQFWDFLQTNAKDSEIIGNIHDNPELLGDK